MKGKFILQDNGTFILQFEDGSVGEQIFDLVYDFYNPNSESNYRNLNGKVIVRYPNGLCNIHDYEKREDDSIIIGEKILDRDYVSIYPMFFCHTYKDKLYALSCELESRNIELNLVNKSAENPYINVVQKVISEKRLC